jgi:hypothetical protein
MAPEIVQFGLLLSGWIVSFLLGKELYSGYLQWRTRSALGGASKGGPRP